MLAGGQLEGGIVAEGLVVVEVLVAQGDGDDPLGEHGALVVDDEVGMSRGRGWRALRASKSPSPLGDLAEQQGAGVGGEPAAVEVGDDRLGPEAGKGEGFAVTVCHGDGLAVWRGGACCLTQILQGVRPSRNSNTARRMKYPG